MDSLEEGSIPSEDGDEGTLKMAVGATNTRKKMEYSRKVLATISTIFLVFAIGNMTLYITPGVREFVQQYRLVYLCAPLPLLSKLLLTVIPSQAPPLFIPVFLLHLLSIFLSFTSISLHFDTEIVYFSCFIIFMNTLQLVFYTLQNYSILSNFRMFLVLIATSSLNSLILPMFLSIFALPYIAVTFFSGFMSDPKPIKEDTTAPEAPEATTDSQESTSQATPSSSKNKEYNRNVYIMLDVNHKIVEPKDVIEYEWPPKSGDRWFLQEQIGELLNIKSFSRKYPDFTRRKVNHEEREYLEWNYGVTKLLNETQLRDLNAMRASEIHDMMNSDFADIYWEYKRVVAAREKEIQMEKAKEMEAIKNDSVKLAELRKKAVQSAVAFNKDLQNQRRNDRKHFWDIQTNIIQSRRNRWLVMKPEATRPGPYPVALIPGQYQTYYKKFTPEELNRLPLGTVMDTSHLFPPHREASPPPLTIAEQDLIRLEREEAMRAREATMNPVVQIKQEPAYVPPPIDPNRPCDSCEKIGGGLICCTICEIAYHPECIEMPDRMANTVKTYEWACVDCRVCSICSKAEKDDDVVFCDRCDRGFHTYCVGLKQMPRGSWICTTFCSPDQIRAAQARRSSIATGRR